MDDSRAPAGAGAADPLEPRPGAADPLEPGDAGAGEGRPPQPRRGIFDLEGRAAPGLYVAAWALAIVGLGAIFAALAGGGRAGAGVAFVAGIAALSVGLATGAGAQALQRRADGSAYTGPSPVLVFVAAFGLALVAGFALRAIGFPAEGPAAVLVSVVVTAAVSVGLVAVVVVSPGGLSWRELGVRLPGAGEGSALRDVAWGMTLAVPTLFVAALLASVLIALLGVAPEPTLPVATDAAGVLVNLLAAVVVTPLWEELFFRGFVTTAWARARGQRAAIVRGAVFFSFIHVLGVASGDFDTAIRAVLITFVVRLPVALVLGWVFLRRRTLVAPIALHATYNALPILIAALGSGVTAS